MCQGYIEGDPNKIRISVCGPFFIYMNQLHLKDVHEQSNISWSVEGLHTEVGEGWWTTVENGRSEENPRRTYVTQCPE